MPAWSNTDAHNAKPKFDVERETRETVQLLTANTTAVNSDVITLVYNDGAGNNVANIGVSVNSIVFAIGSAAVSTNGTPGFFSSNNYVVSISGNTVTLASNVTTAVPAGTTLEFDKLIVRSANKPVELTYNADTVLVTPTRRANATVALGDTNVGWVHIQKKVMNGDSANARYISETLVALSSPVAANTNSGNTSFGQIFTGV